MASKAIAVEPTGLLVKYDVTEEAIEKLREECKDTSFDTPAAYEIGRKRIATLRELRGKVEDRRKDLKADSLEFGRKVDSAARVLTNKLKEIEEPLIAARKKIDDEEARIKREAERAELIALETKLKADREAAEAKAKEEREAEQKRLAEERAKLDADKARQDAANAAIAEQQRLEGERIAVERAKLETDRRIAEEARVAAQKIEDDRQAELRRQQQERQAEIDAADARERAAAAAPDVDKLKAFEGKIRALMDSTDTVKIASSEVQSAFTWANSKLLQVADTLAKFKIKGAA